jgi:hypothetical protein
MILPKLQMAKKTQNHNHYSCGLEQEILPSLVILLLAGRSPALPASSSNNSSKLKKYLQKYLHEP